MAKVISLILNRIKCFFYGHSHPLFSCVYCGKAARIKINPYYGACFFIQNKDGLILSVSRKDNKFDYGLPGGKIEYGETPLSAARRELFEETGLKVDPEHVYIAYEGKANGKLAICYGIDIQYVTGDIFTTENGYVGWVKPEALIKGTFRRYNKGLLKNLNIKY